MGPGQSDITSVEQNRSENPLYNLLFHIFFGIFFMRIPPSEISTVDAAGTRVLLIRYLILIHPLLIRVLFRILWIDLVDSPSLFYFWGLNILWKQVLSHFCRVWFGLKVKFPCFYAPCFPRLWLVPRGISTQLAFALFLMIWDFTLFPFYNFIPVSTVSIFFQACLSLGRIRLSQSVTS